MINIYHHPESVTLNAPLYLLDDSGKVMRFPNIEEARARMLNNGIEPDTVHYEEEDEVVRTYRDVMESVRLALNPYVGKILDASIIKSMETTVYDAICNNIH